MAPFLKPQRACKSFQFESTLGLSIFRFLFASSPSPSFSFLSKLFFSHFSPVCKQREGGFATLSRTLFFAGRGQSS